MPVIVIARFAAQPGDGPLADLTDVFRTELLAALVRFREWSVVEGHYAPRFGADTGPDDEAYRLQGLAVADGDDMRLTLTLLEPVTHRYLWSRTLALAPSSFAKSCQQAIEHLALALNVHISADRLRRSGVPDQRDAAAYDPPP